MASTDKTAKFSVGLDNQLSGEARAAAQSLDDMRAAIEKSEAAIKGLSSQQRQLRGTSEAVVKAREQIKAQMNAEREAVSKNSLALFKQGTSLSKLTEAKKAAEERTKKLAEADKKSAQALEPLTSKLGSLKDILTGATSAEELAALAAGGLVVAIAAVGAAVVIGVAALAKWVVATRDVARSQGLLREAITGSALQAGNLGTQVDALARKVATPKAALNDLAVSLAKSRIEGQTLVDTFNAVGQASAALGEEAGGKLKSLIERGRTTQRFSIGDDRFSDDLAGTGLKRDDVAKQLAKNLKVSVEDARLALAQGRVKLGDGAKALRDAVETRLGGINLRKMLSLESLSQKFGETLSEMTEAVDIEPLLKGFKSLSEIFDQTSYTGAALKSLITVFGNTLATTFETLAPFGAQFFKGIVLASLDLAIGFFKVRNALKASFGDTEIFKNVDWMKTALEAGKLVVFSVAAGIITLGAVVALAVAPFVAFGVAAYDAFDGIRTAGAAVFDYFGATNFTDIGSRIIDGLVNGLKAGASRVTDAVKGMAGGVKDAFKDALGIHSPSREFAKLGKFTAEGYSEGVEQGTPMASDALVAMAAPPALSSGAGGGGGSFNFGGVIHITINTKSDKPEEIAKAVTSPDVLSQFGKAIDLVAMSAGLPVRG